MCFSKYTLELTKKNFPTVIKLIKDKGFKRDKEEDWTKFNKDRSILYFWDSWEEFSLASPNSILGKEPRVNIRTFFKQFNVKIKSKIYW